MDKKSNRFDIINSKSTYFKNVHNANTKFDETTKTKH